VTRPRGADGIAASAALLLSACVSAVVPPDAPEDPVSVVHRKEARHGGLLLPREEGGFVEYGFGDRDWYALGKDSWFHVFDTLLWPTMGTLGRREVEASDLAGLERIYPHSRLTPIVVGEAEIARLRERLEGEFAVRRETRVYNSDYALFFVEHEDGFWLLHNCHDAVAEWLRELGCTVARAPVRLGLSVRRAGAYGRTATVVAFERSQAEAAGSNAAAWRTTGR